MDTSTDELTTESANESKEQPVSVRIMSLLDKLRDGLQYTVIEQRDAAHFCAPSISAESILDEALNGWLVHVAEDPNAQIEVLSELARAADAEIRIAVAENRNTPRELLLILAQDENPDVRYAMAENHNLDAIIIESFLEDDNPYVCERAKRTLSRLQEKSVIAPQFRQENESSKRQSVMH